VVIILGLVVMSKVIVGYRVSQDVLGSREYRHSEETIWLWKQGMLEEM
jgi:hypothetical protein